MKKLILILAIVLLGVVAFAQGRTDVTVSSWGRQGTVGLVHQDTLTSAQADTVDFTIYRAFRSNKPICGAFMVTGVQNSGTSEGYVKLFGGMSTPGTYSLPLEQLNTAADNDTLASRDGFVAIYTEDAGGWVWPYLRLTVTNKSQTQNTTYRVYFEAVKCSDDNK